MVCARASESSRTSVGCRSHTSVWPEPGSSWLHYIHPGAPSGWMRARVYATALAPSLSLSKNGIFHSTFKVMLCRRHYLVQREIPSRKGRKSWSLPHTLSLSTVSSSGGGVLHNHPGCTSWLDVNRCSCVAPAEQATRVSFAQRHLVAAVVSSPSRRKVDSNGAAKTHKIRPCVCNCVLVRVT